MQDNSSEKVQINDSKSGAANGAKHDALINRVAQEMGSATRPKSSNEIQAPQKGEHAHTFILLQVDGLAYEVLQEAIRNGSAPNLAKLSCNKAYDFKPLQTGLPSETIPVLSKMFYGQPMVGNDWYSKSEGKPVDGVFYENTVKTMAASRGERGLMFGGKAAVCELSGGAGEEDTRMVRNTFYNAFPRDGKLMTVLNEAQRDLPALWHQPEIIPKMIGNFVASTLETSSYLKEHGQWNTWSDKHAPLMISASDYVFPPLITDTVKTAVKEGRPSVFGDFSGYDERAHFFGTTAPESFKSIALIDKEIGRTVEWLEQNEKNYDLVILSDHGQTPSIMFTKQFGKPVQDVLTEMAQEVTGRVLKPDEIKTAHDYPLLNVYFNSSKSKLQMSDIEKAYPGMIDKMIQHPGIGLLVARANDKLVVIGKEGRLTLSDSGDYKIDGKNPLAMYIDKYQNMDTLCKQIRDYAAVEDTGDLILFSPFEQGHVYDYNTTYTLVSGHGGLGGNQKVPFIIYGKDSGVNVEQVNDASQLHPQFERLRNKTESTLNPGRFGQH